MKKLFKTYSGEIKGINVEERSLTAYVSTGATDRMNESLDPAGADMKNFKKNPVVLFAHNYSEPPIGKALWIKKDGKGLLSKVQFAKTAFAEEIFGLYKDGFMNSFSVGFQPTEWEDNNDKSGKSKKPDRVYTKWELLEYSAVPVPANPEALALAMQKGVMTDVTKQFFMEDDTKTNDVETSEEDESGTDSTETETETEKESEKKNEEQAEEESQEKKIDILGDAMAEVEILQNELNIKNIEIKELRQTVYNLYYSLNAKPKGIVAEIADEDLAKKIGGILGGAINHARGKI